MALALVGAVLAGLTGVSAARGALARGARPFVAAATATLWLAAVPAAILLLNGLRVTNCDPLEGLAFYLVGPGLSMLFASQVGAAATLVSRRRRWAIPLFVAAWLAAILWDVWHLYRHPPIFAYNAFVGFFSGAVYDDVISIDGRLALYRLANLAQISVLWAFARLAWDPAEARLSRARLAEGGRRGAWLALAGAAAVAATFFGLRAEIGYELTRDDIVERLGGRVEDERLTIIYDRASVDDAGARALLEDHRYRLHQLEATLGDRFPHRITSFVYGDTRQKRLMMGASRVYIAKPWLREIHLNRVPYGHPVVLHELAHVVLGMYAPGPLRIPTEWLVLPHMALVEGAAEAFEWDTGELSPHQWSAAMRRAEIAPAIQSLMGPEGFYLQSSSKAYTMSGSFIRWLIDTRGVVAFKACYAQADFAAAYGAPVEALLTEWEGFVDAAPLPEPALALARDRFSGKAVFFRVCPLEVARLEGQARRLAASGHADQAMAVYEEVVGFVPDAPHKRLPILSLLAGAGRADEAVAAHEGYLALDGRNPVLDARAAELVGDALWRSGRVAEAAALYAAVADTPQPEDRWRNVRVKAAVAADPEREPILGPYLLGGGGAAEQALAYLADATLELGDDPLVVYLMGRRLALEGRHEEAVAALRQALARLEARAAEGASAPPWLPWVYRETWRLVGHALFDAGRLAEAGEAFEEAARRAPWDGLRDRYLDWAARARWKAAR